MSANPNEEAVTPPLTDADLARLTRERQTQRLEEFSATLKALCARYRVRLGCHLSMTADGRIEGHVAFLPEESTGGALPT